MGKYTRKRYTKRRNRRRQKGAKKLTKKQTEQLIKTLKHGRLKNLKDMGWKERAEKVRDDKVLITKAFGAANARADPDIIDRIYKTSQASLPRSLATAIRPAAEEANRRRVTWRRQASSYVPENRYTEGQILAPMLPMRQGADNQRLRPGTKRYVQVYPHSVPDDARHYGFTQADIHESARYPQFGIPLRVVDRFTNQGGRKTKKLR